MQYGNKIIDGKALAGDIFNQLQSAIAKLPENQIPKLAIILVGDNSASHIYVRNKIRNAQKIGMHAEIFKLSDKVSNAELLEQIETLNNENEVDGIIVQLPLPKQINISDVINKIDPDKDVDGFHPVNVGYLYSNLGQGFVPCTAKGVLQLIKSVENDIAGKRAVVIGRSNIVGRPVAALLLNENCTVSIAHSKTKNLRELSHNADIIVSAIGSGKFLDSSYVKEGALVIDVGINRIEYEDKCDIVGDVDFQDVIDLVKYITPVPGGVGPMTVANLLRNCYIARARKLDINVKEFS